MNVEETIKDRHEKYGEFSDYAEIAESLNRFIADPIMPNVQAAALRLIFVKIARVLTGDPNLVDNWHDIAGYALLVEKELTK